MFLPKVSCILPTGYGNRFVSVAIGCFLTQVYLGEMELVIVDNNDTPLLDADEIEALPETFVYVRSKRMSVADLRNLGTQHATGDVCITWDEDDWSHPNRIAEQVRRLEESGKAVTGWHNILYYDAATGGTFKYFYSPNRPHPPYAIGTSQCYLKSWWEKHPFRNENGVEDRPFSDEAMHWNQLDSLDAGQLCVARVHGNNVIRKNGLLGHHKQFPEVERSAFPQEFFAAIGERNEVPANAAQE
jgi:glycosyltransferase involved in cell wall biosynthesis